MNIYKYKAGFHILCGMTNEVSLSKKQKIFLLLLLVLAIATFLRFYQLSEIPPGLYPDVAINGNDAIQAYQTGEYKWFYPENNGREGLFFNLIAFSFAIFGISLWSLKFVPAIIGTLTVLGMYLMTKQLFELSTKQQITNDKQIQNSNNKNSKPFGISNLDNWNLFGAWDLRFGISAGTAVALLSAFFVATSFWHIIFSRLGFRAIMVPFFLVWSFYFLFKAMRMTRIERTDGPDINKTNLTSTSACPPKPWRRWGYWLIAGLLFGLGFHTYIAFRVAPLLLAPILLIEVINYWPKFKARVASRASLGGLFKQVYIKDGWWLWDLFFIGIIIAVLPLALHFYNNPQDFMGRTGQVSVFASENPLKMLAITTVKTLGMFNIWGDCNWRHNYACAPQLPLSVGILFLIGLWLTIRDGLRNVIKLVIARRNASDDEAIPKYSTANNEIVSLPPVTRNDQNKHYFSANKISWIPLFLLTWFFAMLLPAILTNEGLPHALRVIGAIPPVFILTALGAWWFYDKMKLVADRSKFARISFMTATILFVAWLPLYTFDRYIIQWGQNPEVQGAHTQYFVDIGNYLNNLPPETKKYVIVNEGGVPVPYPDGVPMPAQTIMFVTHGTPNVFYLEPSELAQQEISPQEKTIFILMRHSDEVIEQLQKKMPQGESVKVNGVWTFQIKS